jgi:hypothetical protein
VREVTHKILNVLEMLRKPVGAEMPSSSPGLRCFVYIVPPWYKIEERYWIVRRLELPLESLSAPQLFAQEEDCVNQDVVRFFLLQDAIALLEIWGVDPSSLVEEWQLYYKSVDQAK